MEEPPLDPELLVVADEPLPPGEPLWPLPLPPELPALWPDVPPPLLWPEDVPLWPDVAPLVVPPELPPEMALEASEPDVTPLDPLPLLSSVWLS